MMATRKRGRPFKPASTAEADEYIRRLEAQRDLVNASNRKEEKRLDDTRKIRLGARLIGLVRRGDDAARRLFDKIRSGLRPQDRPPFENWHPVPQPPSPVELPSMTLPRTLQEIDAEIKRARGLRDQCQEEEEERESVDHQQRCATLGGGVLALARDGSREAAAMIDHIIANLPKAQRPAFKGWDPPRVPPKNTEAKRRTPDDTNADPEEPPAAEPAADPVEDAGRKPAPAAQRAEDTQPAAEAGSGEPVRS